MLKRNPRATVEHFLWNWRLAPSGLQVLLFNCTSGKINPDYAPVRIRRSVSVILSVLLLAVWGCGFIGLLRNWRYWWDNWFRARLMGWIGMLAVVSVTFSVITTQRPRPSYLFSLSVFLMAVTGMSLTILSHRWQWLNQSLKWAPLGVVGLVFLVPPYYSLNAAGPQQPLATAVRRLLPHEATIIRPGATVMLGDYAGELSGYVGRKVCKVVDYGPLLGEWKSGPLEEFLAAHKIEALYLNEWMIHILEQNRLNDARKFLKGEPVPGWELVDSGNAPAERWRLYKRVGQ